MIQNGFYFRKMFVNNASDVAWFLKRKLDKKEPHLLEMVKIPQGWDRKHKQEVDKKYKAAEQKAADVFTRYQRRINYCSMLNIAYLQTMSEEKCKQILTNLGTYALRWWECLPLGITLQMAADSTGIKFCYDHGWKGSVNHFEWFIPKGKSEKGRMFAHKI
jgi:hypothetical protein